jgi:hypothetical protein
MVKPGARRTRILVVGVIVAAAIGLWRPTKAGADPSTASIVVPPGGLTFRTPEGRVLARLSSDTDGAVLELYDAHERPTAAWRGGASERPAMVAPDWTAGGIPEEIPDPWRGVAKASVRTQLRPLDLDVARGLSVGIATTRRRV